MKPEVGTRIRVHSYDILSPDDQLLVAQGIIGQEFEVLKSGWMTPNQLSWVEVEFNGRPASVFSDEFEVIA